MKDKMCRICWNTDGWRKPSGAVRETRESFAAKHGFGMEEWFFNYEWCIDGYKFGYLTPIFNSRSTYEGKTVSAALYTFAGPKFVLLVAEISKVYVPNDEELSDAFEEMERLGWVKQMQEDIRHVDSENQGASGALKKVLARPVSEKINVRFHPNDVKFYDPMPRIDWRNRNRYQLYNRNDELRIIDDRELNASDDPTRCELSRKRAAQQGTTVDPRHVRLQNRLYETLCQRLGKIPFGMNMPTSISR